jgi:hypothetical protein
MEGGIHWKSRETEEVTVMHPSDYVTDTLEYYRGYTASNKKKNCGVLVRQRTIPTEQPPLVGEVSANFSG